jgi:hypothetical protein
MLSKPMTARASLLLLVLTAAGSAGFAAATGGVQGAQMSPSVMLLGKWDWEVGDRGVPHFGCCCCCCPCPRRGCMSGVGCGVCQLSLHCTTSVQHTAHGPACCE